MDSLSRHYEEIVNRIKSKTPDFDEYKFHILVVDENNFDGMPVQICTYQKIENGFAFQESTKISLV